MPTAILIKRSSLIAAPDASVTIVAGGAVVGVTAINSTPSTKVASSTSKLLNCNDEDGGESDIDNSNNDSTITNTIHGSSKTLEGGKVASYIMTEAWDKKVVKRPSRPRYTFLIHNVNYLHYVSSQSKSLTFTCKDTKGCHGSFTLSNKYDDIHKLECLQVHNHMNCNNTVGEISKLPTIYSIVAKINDIFSGKDTVGVRKSKDDIYKLKLRNFLGFPEHIPVPQIDLTKNKKLNLKQSSISSDNDDREMEEEFTANKESEDKVDATEPQVGDDYDKREQEQLVELCAKIAQHGRILEQCAGDSQFSKSHLLDKVVMMQQDLMTIKTSLCSKRSVPGDSKDNNVLSKKFKSISANDKSTDVASKTTTSNSSTDKKQQTNCFLADKYHSL